MHLMSEILARRPLRNEHLRKPHDKKSAPAKQHGIWQKKKNLKAEEKATFYSLVKIKAPVLVSKNTEERMFVVDSGASMHMLSKKDLSSDEMNTLWRSVTPTTVMSAYGEVQTNEEAQVYVQDLDLFVTVQILEETPAVLSLGKLCSEHGCSYEWKKRRNSTFDQRWEDNYLHTGQLSTSRCIKTVIIFQQHFVFNIEIKGSV